MPAPSLSRTSSAAASWSRWRARVTPATWNGHGSGTLIPSATNDSAAANRTLTVVVGRAPDSLASKPLRDTGQSGSPVTAFRAFNAGLVMNDNRESPQPYLAESVPRLGTDSWRLLPDGR